MALRLRRLDPEQTFNWALLRMMDDLSPGMSDGEIEDIAARYMETAEREGISLDPDILLDEMRDYVGGIS